LDFMMKMFLAFGFAFEIPIATSLLVSSGITTSTALSRKRPYFIIGCFVLGMMLTPPDIISQLLLAIPAWVLFEIGVVVAKLIEKRQS
jgi:sec-independent protein translocase protein TatC